MRPPRTTNETLGNPRTGRTFCSSSRRSSRGADVNARTHIGGRTPLRVALESDERRRHLIEPSESSKAVLAALRAAGGRDEGCAGSPSLPVYSRGRLGTSAEWRERAADGQPKCEYDLPFSVPIALNVGGMTVPGSFTAPNAEEALLLVRRAAQPRPHALCGRPRAAA